MPFTFAHPAIILPILRYKKVPLSATGLIVGSITPDFEYFFRMKNLSLYSHNWLGLFWFDIPIALMLCFVFHLVIKKPLLNNFNYYIKTKTIENYDLDWIKYFKNNPKTVIISLLIGCASHIFWDDFTHHKGVFVSLFPVFSTLIDLEYFNIYFYRLLQHLSTLIGSVIIIIYFIRLPKQCTKQEKKDTTFNYLFFWIIFSVIVLIIIYIRALFFPISYSISDFLLNKDFLISIISALSISLFFASMVWNIIY